LSVNRLDFWNLEEELTPYELMVHYIAQQIEPIGAERDDIRSALHALIMVQSMAHSSISPEQINNTMDALTNYLGLREEPEVSGEQAARMFGAL